MKVDIGEIVFCDIEIYHNKKTYIIQDVVYKNDGKLFSKSYYLDKLKIKEPVKFKILKIKSRLGFESKATGFTVAKANNEQRNKTTGVYE